ncbi:hypothetical protein COCSUDRAFT_45675 [Coccomyxa subellipsoidea C-169]|uniref:Uncharacterized protein n=1 Tax=Coccomyxa subellipsoidea (strain C-169) TaxID=574566 RepID=I0YI27_COCSC|nr:hypothetical protein COCSUDRAFT_45675 [Coccomyxa subellipsoidea C-169]EIE18046.1 hypothetical protein COCSUDRAFT_45675 [Coccomyxa subellipsoidea C-169]|eukprot:XP_005642590.1 hypothetical protein COCSUDRAFT_45675 [Coccomyxa subellipsoidea C-169]
MTTPLTNHPGDSKLSLLSKTLSSHLSTWGTNILLLKAFQIIISVFAAPIHTGTRVEGLYKPGKIGCSVSGKCGYAEAGCKLLCLKARGKRQRSNAKEREAPAECIHYMIVYYVHLLSLRKEGREFVSALYILLGRQYQDDSPPLPAAQLGRLSLRSAARAPAQPHTPAVAPGGASAACRPACREAIQLLKSLRVCSQRLSCGGVPGSMGSRRLLRRLCPRPLPNTTLPGLCGTPSGQPFRSLKWLDKPAASAAFLSSEILGWLGSDILLVVFMACFQAEPTPQALPIQAEPPEQDGHASKPADALLALATPSPPAAVEPPSPLLLTAVPHHVATQRTGGRKKQRGPRRLLKPMDLAFPIQTDGEVALFFSLHSDSAMKNRDGSDNFVNMATQFNAAW